MSETDATTRAYLHVLIDHLPDGEVLEAAVTLLLHTCRSHGRQVPPRPEPARGHHVSNLSKLDEK